VQQETTEIFPAAMWFMFRFLLVGENRQADTLQDIQAFNTIIVLRSLSMISSPLTAVYRECMSPFAMHECKIWVLVCCAEI